MSGQPQVWYRHTKAHAVKPCDDRSRDGVMVRSPSTGQWHYWPGPAFLHAFSPRRD